MERASNHQRQKSIDKSQPSGTTHIVTGQIAVPRVDEAAKHIDQISTLSLFERLCLEWKDVFLPNITDFCDWNAILAMRLISRMLRECITSFIFKRNAVGISFDDKQFYPCVQPSIQDKLNFATLYTNIHIATTIGSLGYFVSPPQILPINQLRFSLRIHSDQSDFFQQSLSDQSKKLLLAQVQTMIIQNRDHINEFLALIAQNIKTLPHLAELFVIFVGNTLLKLPDELKQLTKLIIQNICLPFELSSDNNLVHLSIEKIDGDNFELPLTLTNLRQLKIGYGKINLSGPLNNLRELSIGSKATTFAPSLSLDNLESFTCESLPKNINDKLLASLKNITSFTYTPTDGIVDHQFICSLTNLKSLSLQIGGISLKLPNTICHLTQFSILYLTGGASKAYLGLPDALTCLTHLRIEGNMSSNTLELPDTLNNLVSLYTRDIYDCVKFKLPGSDSALNPLINILPTLSNLTNLTIGHIFKSQPVDDNPIDSYDYLIDSEDCLIDSDDNSTDYQDVEKHIINLPESLKNFVINSIASTAVVIESQESSMLETLVIRSIEGRFWLTLSKSLNKLSSLKIGSLYKDSALDLSGSPMNLTQLTINLKYQCMFTISEALPNLTTLIIEDNCDPDVDDNWDYSADSDSHSLKGSLFIAADALPNLKKLKIKGQLATLNTRNGIKNFVIETENSAINNLLDSINRQINNSGSDSESLSDINSSDL